MSVTDLSIKAVQAVVDILGPGNAKNPRVADDFLIAHGRVFRVDFEAPDGSVLYNYAHFDDVEFRVFPRSRDLVQFIARKPSSRNVALHILQVAGGTIALVITLTICYLALKSQAIPEVLGHALTAILGFYFASSVYESTKDRKA